MKRGYILEGKYQVLKRIARGGMADIYIAESFGYLNFSRKVIIKTLLPQYLRDKELIKMFIDEAKTLSILYHPNIVQVIDFQFYNDEPFIVMEYIEGSNLLKIQTELHKLKKRLGLELSIFIIYNVLEALDYSHNLSVEGQLYPIIHRDISPQNILISNRGEVKLIDFGIAKRYKKLNHTYPGAIKGKWAYLAPEQRNTSDVDERADIYSVSLVLLELLSGLSTEERIEITLYGEKTVQRYLKSLSIPEDIKKVLSMGLREDPNNRLENATIYKKWLKPYISKNIEQELLQRFVNSYIVPSNKETEIKVNKNSNFLYKNGKIKTPKRVKKKNQTTLYNLQAFEYNRYIEEEPEKTVVEKNRCLENNLQSLQATKVDLKPLKITDFPIK